MAHCLVENTTKGLDEVLEAMRGFDTIDEYLASLNKYEKSAFTRLKRLCEQFIDLTTDEDSE